VKFEKSKSSVFPLNGIFTLGSPSNIDSTTISYNYARFGAFVSSVTIKTIRDLTNWGTLWPNGLTQDIDI
jgi:hypothetical protein